MKTTLGLFIILCATTGAVHAIDIVSSGATGNQVNISGTYAQNFDTLSDTMPLGGNSWKNNITLPGWYSTSSVYGVNQTEGSLSSYGSDASDRALGGGITNWSLRFVNTTAETISGFSVSFDVEQWYRGANDLQVTNSLFLYYRIYDSSVSEAVEADLQPGPEWVLVSDAIFISPNATLTSGEMLDGNLAENRGFVSVTVDDLILAPGEKFWLQWATGNEPGNDHALATDNVAVSFITAPIPEPAAFAALAGLGALTFAQTRRRRTA